MASVWAAAFVAAGCTATAPDTGAWPVATATPPAATAPSRVTVSPAATVPAATAASTSPAAAPAALAPAGARRPGAYYLDDGPGDRAMIMAATAADAEPRAEPLHPRANRPYQVFGRDYVPLTERRAFRERGMASWYGRKFHGQPTSTGEPYDMYAMTGAHPTLPLPSFVRVTHLQNGRSVVVRINDRGPFLKDRVIDLSAAAAWRLGYYDEGSAPVEVELIGTGVTPEGQDALRLVTADPAGAASAAPSPAPTTGQADPGAAALSSPRFAHYVQLAAFGSAGAAEVARRRMQAELDWLDVPVRIVENASVHRVQAGPFDAFARAREVADRVEKVTGRRPWIVARP